MKEVISTMQIQADMIDALKKENEELKNRVNKLKFQLHEFTSEE